MSDPRFELHVEVSGTGPPLVLLHGFTGSSATWAPLRARLDERVTTIAIDLPGHGRSPAPAASGPPAAGSRAEHDAFDALAAALVRVLDERRIATASWLGYSMGGRVALQVALRRPDRVARLVLESASPGIDDPGDRARRRAADGALADSLLRDGIEAFADRWMAQPLFASQRRLAPAVLARERARRLENLPTGLAWALRTLGAGCQASLWPRLGELAVPTLVVVGALDEKYQEIGSATAARIPQAVLEVVPDAGHAVHLEAPAAFLAAVERFLRVGCGRLARNPRCLPRNAPLKHL